MTAVKRMRGHLILGFETHKTCLSTLVFFRTAFLSRGKKMNKAICLCITLSLLLSPYSNADSACSKPRFLVTDLIASQHYDVGDVTIWNDADFLYVEYKLSIIWLRLYQTHLHVATSLEDIPQSNGNAIPGQFAYKTTHKRWVQNYTYQVPLDESWETGTELYIASHATITGICNLFATAWGDGINFPGNKWGTYIIYTLQLD